MCNQYLSPLKLWVRTSFMARCTRRFSPDTLISSTNKPDRHDITDILLKVALSTINLNIHYNSQSYYVFYRSRGHSETCTYLYKYLITDKAMKYTPISVCSVVPRVKMSCLSGHVKNIFKQWRVYYVYTA